MVKLKYFYFRRRLKLFHVTFFLGNIFSDAPETAGLGLSVWEAAAEELMCTECEDII